MDDENELENQSIDIPIWKRYLLSVTEAAQFYHIGEKRLRQIVDIHPNGEFYLLVGLGCQKPILIFDFACTLKI